MGHCNWRYSVRPSRGCCKVSNTARQQHTATDHRMDDLNSRKHEHMQHSGNTFTLRMAAIVTVASLVCLVLGTLLTIWGPRFAVAAGGLFGLIGITGLAQAVIIALVARRR
jgi:hypothetical protein